MKIEACLTDDIARTLLIPLWCCATPCRANPRAAYDPVAVDVLKQLDFDFSEIRRSFKEYGQVCCLAREMNIDRTVRDFLARHPRRNHHQPGLRPQHRRLPQAPGRGCLV